MRVATVGLLSGVFSTGVLLGAALDARSDARPAAAEAACGQASAPQLRTTLYFGLSRPKGSVSELEWQVFLRDEVTPRFPEGLTVWDAAGQWKGPEGAIGHERTKVLLLVHGDTPKAREGVQAVIGSYRKTFEQESVLWETARVCTTW
jgi:hypothetical protein